MKFYDPGEMEADARKVARAQLRKDVSLMRSLGVARWSREGNEIFLGPPPPAQPVPRSVEEEIAARNAMANRQHETLFAASSTRPVLAQAEQGRRATVLKSVVQRPPAQEHDRGKAQGE